MPAQEFGGYMGRCLMGGLMTNHEPASVFFIEGRSPPSRMRKLIPEPDMGIVRVDINSRIGREEFERQVIAAGSHPLLVLYDAMQGDQDGKLVTSNGFQTNRDAVRKDGNLVRTLPWCGVYYRIKEGVPFVNAIYGSLKQAGSEPDPLRTARIASAMDFGNYRSVNFGIVTRPRDGADSFMPEDEVRADYCDIHEPGNFLMIATYGVHDPSGGRPPPLGSLRQYTKVVRLDGTTPEQLVEEVYGALPQDLVVGVAAAVRDMGEPKGFRFAKHNAQE